MMKQQINWPVVIICVTAMCAIPAMLAISAISDSMFNQHNNACLNFVQHVDGLTTDQCIEYLDINPDATGQEMLDHYSNQNQKILDKLLSEPVASLDVDTP